MNIERRKMANKILASFNLSALVFWRPDELVLMLGYMPQWGLSFLLYTADDEPVLFVPEAEPEDILPTTVAIKKFPWGNSAFADPWSVLYKEMKEVLKKKGLSNKPVSFVKNIGGTAPCRMSGEQPLLPADLMLYLSAINDAGFKDTTASILQLYSHKTEADVAGLKDTHQIVAVAVDTFYKCAVTGVSEAVLAARIEYSVHERTGQNNISFARAWPLIQSGINCARGGEFNRTTGRIINDGDWVMLEMAVCVNGYWADITRTTVNGKVTGKQYEIYNTVKDAQQRAIDILKPGVAMRDIDAAARKHIKARGYGARFNHALGHQVGFRYHDPGGRLSPESEEVVGEGMVLTIEPGIYGVELGGGARIEDNVLVTSNGYEILSDYPRGLKGN